VSSAREPAAHTPLPWRLGAGDGRRVVFKGSVRLLSTARDLPESDANAALIVEAVNAHASLTARVAELEAALKHVRHEIATADGLRDDGNPWPNLEAADDYARKALAGSGAEADHG